MRKIFSVLIGAATAFVMGTASAAAEDVTIDTENAVEATDSVTFSVGSGQLSVSQLTADTKVNVSYDGAAGDKSPVKLVLNYWDLSAKANLDIGEPASVEVEAAESNDKTAVFTQEDILKALGETDPSMVFSMDVYAAEKAVTCTGFEATNVYSQAEMADNGILHATWVHAKKPKESENWGQSISVGVDQFDTSTMTDTTWVIAIFESELPDDVASAPVEFILQSADDTVSPKAKNGTVWAKVTPVLFNNHFAMFDYADMIDSYGTDDLSCVTTVYVGDTGNGKIKCTDLYALRCKTQAVEVPEAAESSAAAEESSEEEVTATTTTTTQPAETTAAAESASPKNNDDKKSVSSNVGLIVVGIVAGIVIAGVVVYIILGRKSRETYDISKHRFIKK